MLEAGKLASWQAGNKKDNWQEANQLDRSF